MGSQASSSAAASDSQQLEDSHFKEIIRTLEETLTCAVCRELLDKPQILPCLHKLCEKCVKQLLQKKQIQLDCPTCRSTAEKSQIKYDFDTNTFADIYKKQKMSNATQPLNKLLSADKTQCDKSSEESDTSNISSENCLICEEATEVLCENCLNYFCHKCCTAHLYYNKTCEQTHCHKPNVIADQVLESVKRELPKVKSYFHELEGLENQKKSELKKHSQEVLNEIQSAEDEMIKLVREWHEQQRKSVQEKLQESQKELEDKFEADKREAECLANHLTELTQSEEARLREFQSLKKKTGQGDCLKNFEIDGEAGRVHTKKKLQAISPMKFILENKKSANKAFDPKKAIKVKT